MMKRNLLLAGLALASVASAQAPPDVPANHWAANAVTDLYRLGILRGYPDGLFRGARPATRFELAQGLLNLQALQENQLVALARQAAELRKPIVYSEGIQGLAEIRRRMDALDQDVADLKQLRNESTDLNSRFSDMLDQVRKLREELRIMRIKRQ